MKQRFLVTYEYGQGAIWAWLYAYSKEQIEHEFPELTVHDAPVDWPEWMREYVSGHGREFMTLDIEDRDSEFFGSVSSRTRFSRVAGSPYSPNLVDDEFCALRP